MWTRETSPNTTKTEQIVAAGASDTTAHATSMHARNPKNRTHGKRPRDAADASLARYSGVVVCGKCDTPAKAPLRVCTSLYCARPRAVRVERVATRRR